MGFSQGLSPSSVGRRFGSGYGTSRVPVLRDGYDHESTPSDTARCGRERCPKKLQATVCRVPDFWKEPIARNPTSVDLRAVHPFLGAISASLAALRHRRRRRLCLLPPSSVGRLLAEPPERESVSALPRERSLANGAWCIGRTSSRLRKPTETPDVRKSGQSTPQCVLFFSYAGSGLVCQRLTNFQE